MVMPQRRRQSEQRLQQPVDAGRPEQIPATHHMGHALQRVVDDTPWAHLDIAGTAMGAPKTDINQSWGSGYGVRLLDRLVRDHYES